MLLPFSVFLQLEETSEHDGSDSRQSLTLVGPEREVLASHSEFIGLFGLESEILPESLELGLLEAEHRVASPPLRVDRLCLFDAELLLGCQELLHCFRPEANQQLI